VIVAIMIFAVGQKGEPMRAIDGDALIDKYGDWYIEEGTEEGYIGTIKGIVDSMPTIEPERKTGEWISKGYGEYRCSSCRGIVDLDTEILMSIKSFDYCPYCGSYNGGE
jgi:DNA-directed RNA polymerase subunit RPC12/RpoP